MKPFNQTVGAGVVRSGPSTGDAKECHQVFPKMGLELSSPVGSEGGWDTESCNPTKQERPGDRFRAGVGERMTSGQRVKRSTQVSR